MRYDVDMEMVMDTKGLDKPCFRVVTDGQVQSNQFAVFPVRALVRKIVNCDLNCTFFIL